ncbi:17571_t:CDS:2 [Funneliformis geosporum]|uniref:17571_t:CDS:1 n=1 Tax=Funneliformis geosporum TaxID=1117311 RepID=A0A9W4WRC8_9GLOM|nr:17571_t:CDS:2 [Funneliformis geosporum]
MDMCSKKSKVIERRRKVYTDKTTQQRQQLDGNDVKQRIYLHAEMEFIAVSKRCCYLCELYIDFAQRHGYDIKVSGNHKKIYSGWKLPNVNFKIEALRYILENRKEQDKTLIPKVVEIVQIKKIMII